MQKIISQVVVIGGGPGGYSTAFRCADLGLEVTLIERHVNLGGVCLNVGCIPSKSLLHIAKVINDAKSLAETGVVFEGSRVDLRRIRHWKEKTISKLSAGLMSMAKMRKVNFIQGEAVFESEHSLRVKTETGENLQVNFEYVVIAIGSQTVIPAFIQEQFKAKHPRLWDSTEALKLNQVPDRLLVIGGGIIGLEMATFYQALGSRVDIVEMGEQIIASADQDLVQSYLQIASKSFNFKLNTQITNLDAEENSVYVTMKTTVRTGKKTAKGEEEVQYNTEIKSYDAVLLAMGRKPNGELVGAEKAGVFVDEQGFIPVNAQMRTNVPHIFAIGDVVGQPMLAHKAVAEGHVVGEVIAGNKHFFIPKAIPAVAYTQPEIAWVGITEKECQAEGIKYEVAKFPWTALGRALASGCEEGMTKLIVEPKERRIIGGGIVGENAGELLGELTLAIEMGATVEDLALTIHAHPTLYESIGLTAELLEGSITDYPNPKAKLK